MRCRRRPHLFRPFEARTIRLVPTAFHKPPVLERLAPSFWCATAFGESGRASRAVVTSHNKVASPGISRDALATGYGYTFINAAFAYTRPDGNRFNPPAWGAWYSAMDVATSLREVSYHLARALEAASGEYDNTTFYVELLATFRAEFSDLRGVEPKPACLDDDPSVAYPEGQRLGDALRSAGGNGIIYPSARHPGGTCLVAFWPGLIQDFQIGEQWKLAWEGEPEPKITKAPFP